MFFVTIFLKAYIFVVSEGVSFLFVCLFVLSEGNVKKPSTLCGMGLGYGWIGEAGSESKLLL